MSNHTHDTPAPGSLDPGARLPDGSTVVECRTFTADDELLCCWRCQQGIFSGTKAVLADLNRYDSAWYHRECALAPID